LNLSDIYSIIEVDEFIAELWGVHLKVKEEGYAQVVFMFHTVSQKHKLISLQNLSLGLFRSDYMVHKELATKSSVPVIKQVEFNTIASSFGGLSFQTSRLHQ
jgi:glutathione synthase